MTILPAKISDKKQLFEMHVSLFRSDIEKIWGWDDAWQRANFEQEWEQALTEVVYVEGELAGYVQIYQEVDHLYVLNIALLAQHQSKGLGSQIMNTLKQRAVEHGLPLRLSVFKTNQRVIKFYERLGFQVNEQTESGMKMGWEPTSMSKIYSALSVVAPVGERILSGKKTLEIRQWQPDVLPLRDLLIVQNKVRLSSAGVSEDPDGEAVALVDIEEVVPWTEDGLEASCASYWEEGWLAWKVTNVRPVKCGNTVPAKLRIYQIEADLEIRG